MQRGWIAGRYNITEKAHYCTFLVRWQFVNPADTSTGDREREAYRRERILCNNNNIVMYRSRREMTLYTKRGKSVEKGYKKTEIN
jgi:hypothetical protein